jgi:hypothetical protein
MGKRPARPAAQPTESATTTIGRTVDDPGVIAPTLAARGPSGRAGGHLLSERSDLPPDVIERLSDLFAAAIVADLRRDQHAGGNEAHSPDRRRRRIIAGVTAFPAMRRTRRR